MGYVVVVLLSVVLGYGPHFDSREDCFKIAGHEGYQIMKEHLKGAPVKLYCVKIDTLTDEQKQDAPRIEPSQLRAEDFVPEVKE
jgi:hypothetical protein